MSDRSALAFRKKRCGRSHPHELQVIACLRRFRHRNSSATFRGDARAAFSRFLRQTLPICAPMLSARALVGRLRGFGGAPGYLRQCHGAGWALVGDAGYFKDPLTAHGITDALRDAELLSRAIAEGGARGLRPINTSATRCLCQLMRTDGCDRLVLVGASMRSSSFMLT